jgi:hypothetical protein
MGQSAIALLAFLAKDVNVIAAWATVRMEEHAYLDRRSWFVIAHPCSVDADVRWTRALVPLVRSQMMQTASVQLSDLQNARVPASLGSVRMVVHVL